MTATHRPWAKGYNDQEHRHTIVSQRPGFDVVVAELRSVNDDELSNAALIVEAVNAYDALQRENVRLREALQRYMAGHRCPATTECPTKNEVEAALQGEKGD